MSLVDPPVPAVTASNVDLSNCDRELIQFSGAVQPHCALLVLSEPALLIVQASANTGTLLGIDAESLLGQPISAVLNSADEAILVARISRDLPRNPQHVLRTSRDGKGFHVFIHRADGALLMEWEERADQTHLPLQDLYIEVRNSLTNLQATANLDEFLNLAVRKIQELSGFDRVLAYQFLPDQTGKVVAEAKEAGASSYLGLHYPASDIPAPARRLFSMLWLRHLPDVDYVPIPIVGATAAPLDLSLVAGRSVSKMYSKYLQNMGVRATMVITLFKNGQLWGLVSCMHHRAPRHVPYDLRLACEFLGHLVSYLMAAKEDEANRLATISLRRKVSQLVDHLMTTEPFFLALLQPPLDALALLDCGGAAILMDAQVHLLGNCPGTGEISQIVAFLKTAMGLIGVFCTDRLSERMPAASEFRHVASGLMAIRLGQNPEHLLLWFRPAIVQTVQWAGDPSKPVDVESVGGEERLKPRSSFAAWQEEVVGRSHPWADYEIEIITELQRSITEVIAKRSEQLYQLNRELQRKNVELDAFAYAAGHDLKEPLRGIHSFSAMILRKTEGSLDEESRSRMQTIQRLTHRMDQLIETLLHYSRLGRVQMFYEEADLNLLLAEACEMLTSRFEETQTELRVPRPLPTIVCDTVRMREALVNLLSNALKFNDKKARWVEVGWADTQPLTFWVKDNGIGIAKDHHQDIFRIFRRLHGRDEMGGGTGAGLTIVRKIIECHGGTISVESTPGAGATFTITLPTDPSIGSQTRELRV